MRRIRKHGKTTEKKTDRILAGGRIPDGEIRVCDVEKYYGSDTNITKAVDRVSFCVQKGEFVGIMGASGSGKTTLMNILTGLDTASEGKVILDGVDAAQLDEVGRQRFRAEKIGLVFQQFHLIPYLTALENVMMPMLIRSSK